MSRQPSLSAKITRLPAGFIIPAQPVMGSRPPSGPDWVHEIKHDGYRMIVHRDGPRVRLYSRNGNSWTARLPAIAAAAERIKAKSFTIDGEAVVLGPHGLSRFEDLPKGGRAFCHPLCLRPDRVRWRGSAQSPILGPKGGVGAAAARDRGRHPAQTNTSDGPTVFAHACRLGAEGIVSKKVDGTYRSGPCRVWIKVRNPASIAVQRERSENWNRRASGRARRR